MRKASLVPSVLIDARELAAMSSPLLAEFGLMDVHDVASLLGVSEQTVRRMRDDGRMPKSLRLGRTERWRRADIQRWIDAGCPHVGESEALLEGE